MKEVLFCRELLISCLFCCFLMVGAGGINAQGSRPVSTVDRRIETINRQTENFEKESMRREARRGPVDRNASTRQTQVYVEEDFYALQDAYNKILVLLNKAKDVSPEFAATSAADIRKHAVRLRNNLALPKPEKDAKEEGSVAPQTAVDRLKMLTRHLYSFVTNPVFENLATLDVELSRKAGKDLDAIIEIAEGLEDR